MLLRIKYILISCLLVFSVASAESLDNHLESKKSTLTGIFLYNFANFVEWPPEAFSAAASPIKMCLFGQVDFYRVLKNYDGSMVRGRTLNIMQSHVYEDIQSGCHILFVGKDQRHRLKDLFSNINHLFVLSVGVSRDFISSGGVINVVRTKDQTSFEIDLDKAVKNGMWISSDLLSLSRIINSN